MRTTRNLACTMLGVLVLAGCGVRGFARDGATQDDFNQDLRYCLYMANTPATPCYPGRFCERDTARNACMERKGWRISREPGRFLVPD